MRSPCSQFAVPAGCFPLSVHAWEGFSRESPVTHLSPGLLTASPPHCPLSSLWHVTLLNALFLTLCPTLTLWSYTVLISWYVCVSLCFFHPLVLLRILNALSFRFVLLDDFIKKKRGTQWFLPSPHFCLCSTSAEHWLPLRCSSNSNFIKLMLNLLSFLQNILHLVIHLYTFSYFTSQNRMWLFFLFLACVISSELHILLIITLSMLRLTLGL